MTGPGRMHTMLRRYWQIPVLVVCAALFVWQVWDDQHRTQLLLLGGVIIVVGGIGYRLTHRR
jgi:hypothetical protein